MFSLDRAIVEWRRQMAAGGVKAPVLLDELESHLRDDVEQQLGAGVNAEQAFTAAIERIGNPSALKSEFENVAATKGARQPASWWRASALAAGLFVLGAGLCYFAVVPTVMRANEHYATWLGFGTPSWRRGDHLGFIFKLMFGAGAAFATPAILFALAKHAILDYHKLRGARRYVIVFNLLLAALLTTPEIVTQIMAFIPLQVIYEVSVWIIWCSHRRELKRL